jgi:hypothetical protein
MASTWSWVNVDGRGVEPVVQLLQLEAHLHAKFCVQINWTEKGLNRPMKTK